MPHSKTANSPTGPAPMIATSVRLTSLAIASPMPPSRPALPWSASPCGATRFCVICSRRFLICARSAAGGEASMLNAAVIGLGWWGKTIVRTLEESAKLRVVRAADRDTTAADWAAERGLLASTDLADALADPVVDAVILCTPHTLHTRQIAQAAAARKQVFCEKPLALRRVDVEESIRLCNANGVVLAVGHERRFEPPMLEMKRLAAAGELGT